MSSLPELLVGSSIDEEPDCRKLRDDQQRDDRHEVEAADKSVNEENRVGHTVIDQAESGDLDTRPKSRDPDHVLAGKVEIVIKVCVATPASSLTEVVFE